MITNPTNEHREQAREIAKRYTREGTGYADRLYQLAYAIEQALSSRDAEIREVLEGLATHQIGSRRPCWCPLDYGSEPHTELCKTARALYAKLQPCTCDDLTEVQRAQGDHYDDCPRSPWRKDQINGASSTPKG